MPCETLPPALHFPRGLVGYPHWRRFRLERPPDLAPLALLESEDEEGVAFVAAEPRLILPDYAAPVPPEARHLLGLGEGEAPGMLVILTVRETPDAGTASVTANLLGPLLINPATGAAAQVVLAEAGYSPHHEVRVQDVAAEAAERGAPCWS